MMQDIFIYVMKKIILELIIFTKEINLNFTQKVKKQFMLKRNLNKL